MREEYAKSYGKLDLPPPLPPAGAPYTELTTGGPEGLPVYASRPDCEETRLQALKVADTKCTLCMRPFNVGATVMCCHHCGVPMHVRCLADRWLGEDGDELELIPSQGFCVNPSCARQLLWSRLVRDVNTYRPSVCSDGQVADNDDSNEIVGVDPGLVVWRVDDSSDDGDDDDDGSDDESEHAAQRDGINNSDAFSDTLSQGAEEDDETFWRLYSGSPGWSQEPVVQGNVHGCGDEKQSSTCRGSSTRNEAALSPTSPRVLAVSRTQLSKPRGEDDVVVVGSTGDRNSSARGGEDREAYEGSPPASPSSLPLAERLRVRRLRDG